MLSLLHDSIMLSGPCVKSKIITEELDFLGEYLHLTLGPEAYWHQKEKISKYLAPMTADSSQRRGNY